MTRKPPPPVCVAFLVCRRITEDPNTREVVLVGLPTVYHYHQFPCAAPLGFFARWSSAHGEYQVEVQLQTPDGEVVWRGSPPQPWTMADPTVLCDLRITQNVIFPRPGGYQLVLLANGEEVARQRFQAQLVGQGSRHIDR